MMKFNEITKGFYLKLVNQSQGKSKFEEKIDFLFISNSDLLTPTPPKATKAAHLAPCTRRQEVRALRCLT